MKVTEDKLKDRQSREEGQLQKVSAEQREDAETSDCRRIAENTDIIRDWQETGLLEKILQNDNLNRAYKKVKSNKGSGGVDGMDVEELLTYLRQYGRGLNQQILEGRYKPNPVRRVEIPKEEKGKYRKLGIPTVVDRVYQQAITQVLTPIFEKQFSENSFGFRPNRGAHDALKQCQRNANDGYVYVVDMDLEKFFDNVSQSKLIEVLSRTIKDGRVVSLIHKYMKAGVVANGMFERTEVGVPQGGPLSPLLSNIMLNELDKEIESRGHRFVRYADDCMIFCKSKKSAERTLRNILPYIEKELFLKVNRQKTSVAHISEVKYLGYTFYNYKGLRFQVHPKSVEKMKKKLRELTDRNNAWSNESRVLKLQQFIRGWVNYFKLADMKSLLRSTDEWLRHRIRAIYWKQWKKVRTRIKKLRKLNLPEWIVFEISNCRKGTWRSALLLNQALTNKEIANLGYISLTGYYLQVHEN